LSGHLFILQEIKISTALYLVSAPKYT
jgi:hypothetical protein